jgi:hypothetical protein
MIEVDDRPVVNARLTWSTMKITNQTNTRKCSERAV